MQAIIQQLLGAAKGAVIEAQGLDGIFFASGQNQEAFRDLVDELDRLMAFYEPPRKVDPLPGSEYEPYEPSPYHGDYSEE